MTDLRAAYGMWSQDNRRLIDAVAAMDSEQLARLNARS
jgi:hypothetical protein